MYDSSVHPMLVLLVFPLRWYFALISISGLFSVTFSVVYSYVADVTDENSRSAAYGMRDLLCHSALPIDIAVEKDWSPLHSRRH